MTLRFSEHGPEFPQTLIDALMTGEVVFLCGSGVSAPQLPEFKSLVDQTYKQLGVTMDASEACSYNGNRFEEVLGALARRLADPEEMVHTVSRLLAIDSEPHLEQHRTVLRLSRDINNRVIVVTTNFDTLLERALKLPAGQVRQQSFAGQSLPAPGGSGFSGVIHLHGRLADRTFNLEATSLVLTSADYGDAYMRSGWASRFLFDLARCKTIVLIGYSANDAPVRYFLNVLESDRVRFPDLRPVYAFDAYEKDPAEAKTAWGTLAVTPLPYCKLNSTTGNVDHSPLWDDLRKLADIIERPKRSREERAQRILNGESRVCNDQQLKELSWLFTNCSDLWPTAVKAITDPRWFHVFQDNKIWSPQDASRVISIWVAGNFEERQRFLTATEWRNVLGGDFCMNLAQHLRQAPPASSFWLKAWRILLDPRSNEYISADDFDENAYALSRNLKSGLIMDRDLVQSVALLAPVLVIQPSCSLPFENANKAMETGELRLSDLVTFDLKVVNESGACQIIETLSKLDSSHALRIIELASAALHSSLEQSVDLDMIADDYDRSDYCVPSIDNHDQNEHCNGEIFLVRAIVNAVPNAVAANRSCIRAQAMQWRTWPGRLGARLLLYTARNSAIFSANEALSILLELDETAFWTIRREFALTLRDRGADATPNLLKAVETRICGSGNNYYAQYTLENEQMDWRVYARDRTVWLRLKMLDAVGGLSEKGRNEFNAIIARQPSLDRMVEDRDFFDTYRHHVEPMVAHSRPILEASPDQRLMVAMALSHSPDIDHRMGWGSYCRIDPKGAFETLAVADIAPNIGMWGALLTALMIRNNENNSLYEQLASDALAHLERLDSQSLQSIAPKIVDLFLYHRGQLIANFEDWCDRLWSAVRHIGGKIDFQKNLNETAVSCAAGLLTRVLLLELAHTRRAKGPYEARQLARLALIADDDSEAGIVGRAVLVSKLSFMLAVDSELVRQYLVPRLSADTDEARGLREVLVSDSNNITPKVTKLVRQAILSGIAEVRPDSGNAPEIAFSILRPALDLVRGDAVDHWGFSEADVSCAIREAPLNIRAQVLRKLVIWMSNQKDSQEKAWEKIVKPFFERVWPKERRCTGKALNSHFISVIFGAGNNFPDAFMKLQPYFQPCTSGYGDVRAIKQSGIPEKFPFEVLELLWLIFGPTGNSSCDMSNILDRLLIAKPELERDRRFQSLDQRSLRYC